jgi:hypothetical protein
MPPVSLQGRGGVGTLRKNVLGVWLPLPLADRSGRVRFFQFSIAIMDPGKNRTGRSGHDLIMNEKP